MLDVWTRARRLLVCRPSPTAGNITTDYKAWTYQYSAENQLVWAKDTALVRQGFYIDYADGTRRYVNRPGIGTKRYYYDGDQEIIETARASESTIGAAAIERRYIRLPGSVDEPFLMIDFTINGSCTNSAYAACERWAHQNYLGSVVAVTDSTGAVAERHTYSPYGESGGSTSGFPFRFTGQKLDDTTGLYYYKARYYDSVTGRFLQTDPVGYEDQMNLYAYVGNDPINNTDPDGRLCVPCVTGAAGAIVGAGVAAYKVKSSGGKIFSKSGGAQILKGAAIGAIAGATGGAAGAGAGAAGTAIAARAGLTTALRTVAPRALQGAATGAVGGGTAGGTQSALTQAVDNNGNIDIGEVAKSTAIGAVAGAFGGAAAGQVEANAAARIFGDPQAKALFAGQPGTITGTLAGETTSALANTAADPEIRQDVLPE